MLKIFCDIPWHLIVKLVWLFYVMTAVSLLDSLSLICSHSVSTCGAMFMWIKFKENRCKYGVKFPGLFTYTPKLHCQICRRNMTMRGKILLILAFQSEKLLVLNIIFEELWHYDSSRNIIWVIKSWHGMQHVWGRREMYTGFWWGNPGERDHLEDPVIDGMIILRWIFGK